jgi:hypothetical protein
MAKTIQATMLTAMEMPESVVAREKATTIGRIGEDERHPRALLEVRELLETPSSARCANRGAAHVRRCGDDSPRLVIMRRPVCGRWMLGQPRCRTGG